MGAKRDNFTVGNRNFASDYGFSPFVPVSSSSGALDMTISTDFLLGRDPAQVFDACVKARSGQFPTRTLDDQPGWVG